MGAIKALCKIHVCACCKNYNFTMFTNSEINYFNKNTNPMTRDLLLVVYFQFKKKFNFFGIQNPNLIRKLNFIILIIFLEQLCFFVHYIGVENGIISTPFFDIFGQTFLRPMLYSTFSQKLVEVQTQSNYPKN